MSQMSDSAEVQPHELAMGGGRTEEDRIFDRQVRLWGPHGQRRIRQAKLLVLGSGATVSETLKNLVLPGIGGFVLVDDMLCTPRDLGNNFYVLEADVAAQRPRAQAMTDLMREMGPGIDATAVVEDITQFVSRAVAPGAVGVYALAQYATVVVDATRITAAVLAVLDAAVRAVGGNVVSLATLGLIGAVRLSHPARGVVESRPGTDGNRQDLRLHCAQLARFPGLVRFAFEPQFDVLDLTKPDIYAETAQPAATAADAAAAESVASPFGSSQLHVAAPLAAGASCAPDWSRMAPLDVCQAHSRVPFPVILVRALYMFAGAPRDAPVPIIAPAQAAEFAAFVRAQAWFPPGDAQEEENFAEAAAHARLVAAPLTYHRLFLAALNAPELAQSSRGGPLPPLPASAVEIAALLAGGDAQLVPTPATPFDGARPDTHVFWIFAAALKAFLVAGSAGTGAVPLVAAIPDMTSQTEHYVALKRVYKEHADADAAAFEGLLRAVVASYGQQQPASQYADGEAGYAAFLAHACAAWCVSDPVKHFIAAAKDLRVTASRAIAEEYFPAQAAAAQAEGRTLGAADVAALSAAPTFVAGAGFAEGMAAYNEDQDDDGVLVGIPYNTQWYVALRAAFAFRDAHARLPGQEHSAINLPRAAPAAAFTGLVAPSAVLAAGAHADEASVLAGIAGADWRADTKALEELHARAHAHWFGADVPVHATCSRELVRQGCEEVHVSASVVGGMASDAVLKLVLGQYVTLNNTLIYNGVHGVGSVFAV